jgi:hypothetical protein
LKQAQALLNALPTSSLQAKMSVNESRRASLLDFSKVSFNLMLSLLQRLRDFGDSFLQVMRAFDCKNLLREHPHSLKDFFEKLRTLTYEICSAALELAVFCCLSSGSVLDFPCTSSIDRTCG